MPTDLEPATLPNDALAALELQDHLMSAVHDLARLELLLDEACSGLLARFAAAADALHEHPDASARRALGHVADAVTALQFQDLAVQLLAHTRRRLDHCNDRLASAAFGDDGAPVRPPPLRPNPVTQAEMAAGSVELF